MILRTFWVIAILPLFIKCLEVEASDPVFVGPFPHQVVELAGLVFVGRAGSGDAVVGIVLRCPARFPDMDGLLDSQALDVLRRVLVLIDRNRQSSLHRRINLLGLRVLIL